MKGEGGEEGVLMGMGCISWELTAAAQAKYKVRGASTWDNILWELCLFYAVLIKLQYVYMFPS